MTSAAPAMKAVAITHHLPVDDPASFVELSLPRPQPGAQDLLVRVHAVSVNPVDTKVRAPKALLGRPVERGPRVLGWDAAGVVEAVGAEVTRFRVGDRVWFAGDITRAGSNADYALVDERIAGPMPRTLSFAEAAALPLTTLTAAELLFDRLGFDPDGADAGRRVLVIGAAGGVGSVAVQLARLAGLHVIGTASRPESAAWARELGAHAVVDHARPLAPQLAGLGGEVDAVVLAADTDTYFDALPALLAPQGRVGAIVENRRPLNLDLLKAKSLSLHWEMMFTRSMFRTPDMDRQHGWLSRVAAMVDDGRVRSTVQRVLHGLTAANLRAAHAQVESGRTIGKWVVAAAG